MLAFIFHKCQISPFIINSTQSFGKTVLSHRDSGFSIEKLYQNSFTCRGFFHHCGQLIIMMMDSEMFPVCSPFVFHRDNESLHICSMLPFVLLYGLLVSMVLAELRHIIPTD